jgi:hypothetical protein
MLNCNECFNKSNCPYEDYNANSTDSQIVCSYYINEKDFASKLNEYEKKNKIGQ